MSHYTINEQHQTDQMPAWLASFLLVCGINRPGKNSFCQVEKTTLAKNSFHQVEKRFLCVIDLQVTDKMPEQ